MAVAEREVAQRLGDWDKIVEDLNEHRNTSQAERESSEFIGEHRGFGITVSIKFDTVTGKMAGYLNQREDTRREVGVV